MIYRTSLNIGHDGNTSAHVHDLMGCATLASTRERAISKLELTIPDYYLWLRSKGERIPAMRTPQMTDLRRNREAKPFAQRNGLTAFGPGRPLKFFIDWWAMKGNTRTIYREYCGYMINH
jgi:predicted RNase H-like HicB family nuclease